MYETPLLAQNLSLGFAFSKDVVSTRSVNFISPSASLISLHLQLRDASATKDTRRRLRIRVGDYGYASATKGTVRHQRNGIRRVGTRRQLRIRATALRIRFGSGVDAERKRRRCDSGTRTSSEPPTPTALSLSKNLSSLKSRVAGEARAWPGADGDDGDYEDNDSDAEDKGGKTRGGDGATMR